MAKLHAIVIKIHRVVAALFLLAILPAGYASFNDGKPEFFVYLPVPFLLALTITGTYQLVVPWIRRRRAASDQQ
jgi:hypothetical protein